MIRGICRGSCAVPGALVIVTLTPDVPASGSSISASDAGGVVPAGRAGGVLSLEGDTRLAVRGDSGAGRRRFLPNGLSVFPGCG